MQGATGMVSEGTNDILRVVMARQLRQWSAGDRV
jgi:hypothetical protein